MASFICNLFLFSWGLVCTSMGGSNEIMLLGYAYLMITNICTLCNSR